jgi:hypothetical protein
MSITKNLLTGRDGETHDIGRYAAAASYLTGLGLQIFVVLRGAPFDFTAFGVGIGALSAGIGAMLNLKKDTEP